MYDRVPAARIYPGFAGNIIGYLYVGVIFDGYFLFERGGWFYLCTVDSLGGCGRKGYGGVKKSRIVSRGLPTNDTRGQACTFHPQSHGAG